MKPIIIANWKMNPGTLRQAKTLFSAAQKAARSGKVEVVVCPPYPYLAALRQMTKKVALGAQNCSWEDKGPLTGEVSAKQLKDIGCRYVIIGHSERKKYLAETLGMTRAKVQAALRAGLSVILCVENARELQMIMKKTKSFKNILVVFEPSSAISTQGGTRVTPEDIANMVQTMKKVAGRNVPVLYGGSVDAKTIRHILLLGKVQGALVGAASLEPKEFATLVKNAL
ncbi:triose-phosphate isomerase [Patescibacteria group bacterium]|nr:triose-phosphate isomerase [Patescibacteria group bacterium]